MSTIEITLTAKAIDICYIPRHTVLMDEDDDEEYGKLLAWTEDPEMKAAVCDERGCPPAAGLILLQTQEKLLLFLIRCVQLLLPGLDLTIKVLQPSRVNVSVPALLRMVDTGSGSLEWRSLMEMNANAAYELPQYFDLDQLLKLATANRDEAQDSIWALTEDPSCFCEVLEEESILFRGAAHKALKAAGMTALAQRRLSHLRASLSTLDSHPCIVNTTLSDNYDLVSSYLVIDVVGVDQGRNLKVWFFGRRQWLSVGARSCGTVCAEAVP